MAALQEHRQGYNSRAGLEPGTSRFSTLHINHYAIQGIYFLEILAMNFGNPPSSLKRPRFTSDKKVFYSKNLILLESE